MQFVVYPPRSGITEDPVGIFLKIPILDSMQGEFVITNLITPAAVDAGSNVILIS
jgi:hypothetical protein